MSEVWTTAELIADGRRQGGLSDDDPDASDAEMLTALNRAQKNVFVPAVRKVRAEYYVTHVDTDLVADQAEYRIPHRAATNSVRLVHWIDSADRLVELTPVSLGDILDYPSPGRPIHYVVKDDRLILLPAPNAALGTLRIYFERRPSTLVNTTGIQTVTGAALNGSNVILAVSGTAADIDGIPLDVVRAKPPFSLAVRDATMSIVLVTGLTYTPGSWDVLPEVGDYLCNAGETCIPQLPVELHPLLALAAAIKMVRPQDIELARELQAELDSSLPGVLASLAPRQQGKQQKIRSSKSFLRRGLATRGQSGFADWE